MARTSGRWRVGSKVGRTVYRDEVLVGLMDTPELAAEVVRALNGAGVEGVIADLREGRG